MSGTIKCHRAWRSNVSKKFFISNVFFLLRCRSMIW